MHRLWIAARRRSAACHPGSGAQRRGTEAIPVGDSAELAAVNDDPFTPD